MANRTNTTMIEAATADPQTFFEGNDFGRRSVAIYDRMQTSQGPVEIGPDLLVSLADHLSMGGDAKASDPIFIFGAVSGAIKHIQEREL